jgi:tRNA(Ile)-lysidine synthase
MRSLSMSVLTERVCRTIERHGLFPPGARVLVAASGGADSTALVCLLVEIAGRLRLEVAGLAHLNHGLRGGASDGDEQFCRELARRHGLRFAVSHADVRAAAREWHRGIEDAGRRLRYDFFSRVVQQLGATHVAVGHTRDDQAETLLLNLLRGAGTIGLAAMQPARDAVVRPLIECSHAELVAWLGERGVPFREDASNLDRRFLRNRVRHDVLPALAGPFPSVASALARSAEIVRAEAAHLDALAAETLEALGHGEESALVIDAGKLAGLPLAVARRVVLRALGNRAGGRFVGFNQVERVLALAAGRVRGPLSLPGQRAEVVAGRLVLTSVAGRLHEGAPNAGSSGNFWRELLSIPGEALLADGRRVSSELRHWRGSLAECRAQSSPVEVMVDAGLVSNLSVRFRRQGDRFRPLGLGGHKSLQDFFTDRKVPRRDRALTPLVVDGGGRIVWVAGFAISEDFRVGPATRDVVILKLRGELG